jgi:hypothetical protein
VSDLLVRDIEDDLKRLIEDSARTHRRSLSEEVKSLVRKGLDAPDKPVGMGTYMMSLVHPDDRGDDLVFEIKGEVSPPPEFE